MLHASSGTVPLPGCRNGSFAHKPSPDQRFHRQNDETVDIARNFEAEPPNPQQQLLGVNGEVQSLGFTRAQGTLLRKSKRANASEKSDLQDRNLAVAYEPWTLSH